MAFKKGEGGRAKGVPNKVTIEVRAAASALVDDPVYRQRLLLRLRNGKLAPGLECMLWYYAKGKPTERLDVVERPSVTIAYHHSMAPPGLIREKP